MPIMSTNFAKTLVRKHEYDVKLWRHKQRIPSTNDHHMPLTETFPWKFSAYTTDCQVYDSTAEKLVLLVKHRLKLETTHKAQSSYRRSFSAGIGRLRSRVESLLVENHILEGIHFCGQGFQLKILVIAWSASQVLSATAARKYSEAFHQCGLFFITVKFLCHIDNFPSIVLSS